MDEQTMKQVIINTLQFMQSEDRNGTWLEWLEEINSNESTFDSAYVIETLQTWYNDNNDEIFLIYINLLK